jgi:hypothetical protein
MDGHWPVAGAGSKLAPSQDLDASTVTNAVMPLTSSSKQFRLRAPGLSDRQRSVCLTRSRYYHGAHLQIAWWFIFVTAKVLKVQAPPNIKSPWAILLIVSRLFAPVIAT